MYRAFPENGSLSYLWTNVGYIGSVHYKGYTDGTVFLTPAVLKSCFLANREASPPPSNINTLPNFPFPFPHISSLPNLPYFLPPSPDGNVFPPRKENESCLSDLPFSGTEFYSFNHPGFRKYKCLCGLVRPPSIMRPSLVAHSTVFLMVALLTLGMWTYIYEH